MRPQDNPALETIKFARLLGHLRGRRPDLLYDALGTNNIWSEASLFFNLGFWDGATTIDQASKALAHLLGERARLSHSDHVLDVGFGFADQDLYWMKEFSPSRIDGVNSSRRQVLVARQRIDAAGFASRIHLHHGDALDLSFNTSTFDKVVALESAFHFANRRKFFRQAHRVLKPGGRLTLTDFTLRQRLTRTVRNRLAVKIGCLSWQIPHRNLLACSKYLSCLDQAGFENIEYETITGQVISPFKDYLRPRLDQGPLNGRYHPIVRMIAKLQLDLGFLDCLDYLMISATKPMRSGALRV